MRVSLCLTLSLLAAAPMQLIAADEGLAVDALSFNIRYGTARDGENSWPNRKELVFGVVRDVNADFVGLQEALKYQIDEIREAVPGYGHHGVGRDDGKEAGEYSSILYRESRWKLDRGATEWLSDTPGEPGSKTWGNGITRIVTWGRFVENESGRVLFVFNTHFDHQSQPSRVKSAQYLAKRVSELVGDEPVIVMGDLNAGESNPAIAELTAADRRPTLVDTFRVLHPDEPVVGTFNGFKGETRGEKIDYIFAPSAAKVVSAEIVRTNVDGRYPSDHFPVSAKLVFAKP